MLSSRQTVQNDLDRPLRTAAVFAGLVAIGAGSRFLEIAPNVAGVAAAAMFAGVVFRSRALAVAVPICAMLISDMSIGGYSPLVMLAVYACLAAPALLGRVLGDRPGAIRVAASGIACSTLFFVMTNLAVWLSGTGVGAPKTLSGLIECYAAAIPFYRNTLVGDACFIAALFGAREMVRRAADRRAQAVTV